MKKIFAILLSVVTAACCLVCFAACGDKYGSVAGKTYHKWHFNPVGEGIIWEDGYSVQFWEDGKTVQERTPSGVRTGEYVQNGQKIKIIWMGAVAPEEWHLENSGKDLYKNNGGGNYEIKESK